MEGGLLSGANVVVLAVLSWLWTSMPWVVMAAVAGKVVTCGRGSMCKLTLSEVQALGGWHLGHGRSIADGPLLARSGVGWINLPYGGESRDPEMRVATVWFWGARPKTDMYNSAAKDAFSATTISTMWGTIRRRGGPTLATLAAVDDAATGGGSGGAPAAVVAPRTFRHIVLAGSYSDDLRTVQRPSREAVPPPYAWQRALLQRVCARAGNTVLWISGPQGCGKSLVADMVAAALAAADGKDVTIYDYNPLIASIGTHWRAVQRSLSNNEHSMVLSMDEADVVMEEVFRAADHDRRMPVSFRETQCATGSGKSSWNALLDNFSDATRGARIVLVMTSNRSTQEVVDGVLHGDGAPLRGYRVHMRCAVDGDGGGTTEESVALPHGGAARGAAAATVTFVPADDADTHDSDAADAAAAAAAATTATADAAPTTSAAANASSPCQWRDALADVAAVLERPDCFNTTTLSTAAAAATATASATAAT